MGKLRYLFLMQIFTLHLSPLNAQDTIIILKNAGFEEAPKQ